MLIPDLSVVAFAVAGLSAAPHCLLMCAPLQSLQLQRNGSGADLLLLHAGRVGGYALLGAIAAAGGLLLFRQLPDAAIGLPLQALAALVLLGLGFRQLRGGRGCCGHAPPTVDRSPGRVFLRGLAWAALPCAPLYAMLFLSMLSRDPAYAALLMLAYGLGTLPLLGSGSMLLRRLRRGGGQFPRAAAGLLIAAGTATAVATAAGNSVPLLALCTSP